MGRLLNLRTAPALVGLALLLVFVFQNSEPVNVDFLWLDLALRKAELILLAAGLGLLVGLSAGLMLRRRKG
ncbi:MAG: hypothetical protein AAFZ65_06010 [Planctomycetota bacterium]